MSTQQVYIDCNRANTDDRDNEDQTNIWTYHLNKELLLPAQTEISVSNVFLNQKGINGQSIEIERDYEERINFYVYVTDDLHPYPVAKGTDLMFANCLKHFNYDDLFGPLAVANTATYLETGLEHGGSGSLLVCYEPFTEGGVRKIRPVINSKIIKVKKGTYGINQLNDIINSQFSGNRTLEGKIQHPFADAITDRTFKGNLCESFAGLTHLVTPYNASDVSAPGNATITNLTGDHVFLQVDDHLDNLQAVKGTNLVPTVVWSDWLTAGGYHGVLTDNKTNVNVDVANYQIAFKKYAVGTSQFKMDYSSDLNGFSINYLHQPYRIPTHDAQKNKNLNEGEEAVLMRSATTDGTITSNETAVVTEQIKSSLNRPVTRCSGVIVHNFSVNKSLEFSKRAEGLASNPYDTFAQIVDDDKKAVKAWSQTLWARLGFSYEQLNDPTKFETNTIYNSVLNHTYIGGVTTDQQIDISVYNQLSCKQSPFEDDVAGGGKTGTYAPFNFIPSNTPKVARIDLATDSNNTKSYFGSPYTKSTAINILTGGRPIVAENLPSLSVHGYYIITSSIVPQYDDLVKGSPLPLLATVPKSNLSNQDFISSNNDITHILTNPIVVNKIQIQVLNPDMTDPDLSNNSSVVIRLDFPIE